MTPQQKIRHLVLIKAAEFNDTKFEPVTGDIDQAGRAIDVLYQELVDEDGHWDALGEIREGEVSTGFACEWSRHYESKAVAARYLDGSWVGWTYWYGGGKHGEPEAIDWIQDAYDVTVTEEEKLVTVQTFTKVAVE